MCAPAAKIADKGLTKKYNAQRLAVRYVIFFIGRSIDKFTFYNLRAASRVHDPAKHCRRSR
jgi:hypothetical protein